jgi:L-rhamnose mutarotase
MKKYVLALDLVDDVELIAEYDNNHKEIWPEIKKSILVIGCAC